MSKEVCASTLTEKLTCDEATAGYFQHSEQHQTGFHTTSSKVGCQKAVRGDEHLVLLRWMGLDDEEETWEPVWRMLEDTPALLKKKLKHSGLSSDYKQKLRKRYRFSLYYCFPVELGQ